ncbi:MAG: FtsB family cell division protein [Longimicrobiaceae bacterium]
MGVNSKQVRDVLRGALVLVILYYAVWAGEHTSLDLVRMDGERAALAARLDSLRAVTGTLGEQAEALESEAAALERVARERYGMIRPGEVLYRFVEVEPESAPALASVP